MRKGKGDIFRFFETGNYDAICITTNGIIKKNGDAVMGAGIAKTCAQKFPMAQKDLAKGLRANGNIVQVISTTVYGLLLSFPTKHHWRDPSDIELIKESCRQLMRLIDEHELNRVLIPKPGCSNGKLDWSEVEPIISEILDDRVAVII